MTTKHTPGPWRAMIGESDPLLIVGGPNEFPVCEVGSVAGATALDEANANLIAAAPDLLAACQSAMDDGFLAGEALDLVAAAIAKARGNT